MPAVQDFKEIDALCEEQRRLSRFASFFYPKALSEQLEAFSNARGDNQAFSVYEMAGSIGFFQRLFFPSLRKFYSSYRAKSCRFLQAAHLLTLDNFNALLSFEVDDYRSFKAIMELKKSSLLTREDAQHNLSIVLSHTYPVYIAIALSWLHKSNLLTVDNRDKVVCDKNPLGVYLALSELHDSGLLNGVDAQTNLNEVLDYTGSSNDLAYIFSVLHKRSLLTAANRSSILGHKNIGNIAHYLSLLSSYKTDLLAGDSAQVIVDTIIRYANLPINRTDSVFTTTPHLKVPLDCGFLRGPLAQANFNAIIMHQNPDRFSQAMRLFEDHLWRFSDMFFITNRYPLLQGSSGQANFNAVVRRQDHPEDVARALIALDKCGLFKGIKGDANRNVVASYTEPKRIAEAIRAISRIRQADFDRLMEHAAILLISDVWDRVPWHGSLNAAQFDQIIAIAAAHAHEPAVGQVAFRQYMDTLLLLPVVQVDYYVPDVAVYNQAQSTHTTSVHQSASESAARLKSNYGSRITEPQLTVVLDSLSKWLNEQPRSLKVDAARRSLDRIRHPHYIYTDERSDVNIQELIALLWVAITDDAKRTGSLQDAQQWMIEALYESQRGGNLSGTSVDRGGNDCSICTSGTFNKFIEKFTGIHSDVNLVIITRNGASAKFQALVKEEALAHLNKLKKDGKIEELSRLLDEIMAADNGNSAEPLWGAISERVADELFGEYKSLYGNDKNDTGFKKLIGTGKDVGLPVDRLEALRREIASPAIASATAAVITPTALASQAGFFASSLPVDHGAGVGPIPAVREGNEPATP